MLSLFVTVCPLNSMSSNGIPPVPLAKKLISASGVAEVIVFPSMLNLLSLVNLFVCKMCWVKSVFCCPSVTNLGGYHLN